MGPRSHSADGPLRILMVSARYLPFTGGTETHIHEVGPRLVAAGHQVTVLTADPTGELPPEETVRGMRVVRARSYPKDRDWCLAPGMLRAAAGRLGAASDVIHVQGYHTLSAPFGMLGALRRGVPFVLTFHSGGNSSAARTRMRSAQHAALAPLAARAAQLVGVSEFEADHFSASMGIPRDRFVVVPNGAYLPPPAPGTAPDPAAPLIVSLGRLERYKGHHRVLDAFALLRASHPAARLRILGEGPYKAELVAMAERMGLASFVEVGGIPPGDRGGMSTLLAGASLVALLSDYEAHPVAVMEALSLGVPVLTSDTSGFIELAERGLVRSVPLDAAPALVADGMAAEMGRPRGPAATLPDWDHCSDRLLEIYRNVVRAAPHRAAGRLPALGLGAAR